MDVFTSRDAAVVSGLPPPEGIGREESTDVDCYYYYTGPVKNASRSNPQSPRAVIPQCRPKETRLGNARNPHTVNLATIIHDVPEGPTVDFIFFLITLVHVLPKCDKISSCFRC